MRRRTTSKVNMISVRDQVYTQLMDLILDGSYPAGMRLDLNEISESMGVSKTPVNEALQGLLREGLITVKPRSGTFVSKIDIQTAIENFGFRLAVEVGAAEAIMERVTKREIDELEHINESMRSRFSGNPKKADLRQAVRDDFSFHRAFVAASGNAVMTEKYCRANALLIVMRLQDLYDLGEFNQSCDEHALIIQNMRDRNIEGLRKACKAHIDCGTARIIHHSGDVKEGAQVVPCAPSAA